MKGRARHLWSWALRSSLCLGLCTGEKQTEKPATGNGGQFENRRSEDPSRKIPVELFATPSYLDICWTNIETSGSSLCPVAPEDSATNPVASSDFLTRNTINCFSIDVMRYAAYGFPYNTYEYHPRRPNSNSAARYIGMKGGLHPRKPPGALGWEHSIP